MTHSSIIEDGNWLAKLLCVSFLLSARFLPSSSTYTKFVAGIIDLLVHYNNYSRNHASNLVHNDTISDLLAGITSHGLYVYPRRLLPPLQSSAYLTNFVNQETELSNLTL
jgi:hypothetical protein